MREQRGGSERINRELLAAFAEGSIAGAIIGWLLWWGLLTR